MQAHPYATKLTVLRRARNLLTTAAVLAVAYRGTRVDDSPHDVLTFALTVLLAGTAILVGARVHVLTAHRRLADAQRETRHHQADASALRQDPANPRLINTSRPGRVHVDLDLMGVDPEVAAAARRIHERLLKG